MKGKIYCIGTGPGKEDLISARALKAIEESISANMNNIREDIKKSSEEVSAKLADFDSKISALKSDYEALKKDFEDMKLQNHENDKAVDVDTEYLVKSAAAISPA